jgi:hypothetical protein
MCYSNDVADRWKAYSPRQNEASRLGMFARSNPSFVGLMRSRSISYWNEYYRNQFKQLGNYPATVAFSCLAMWESEQALRQQSGTAVSPAAQ